MLQAGGGASSYVEPKHILEKTPIKDLEDSEQVRPIQSASVLSKLNPSPQVSPLSSNGMTTTTKASLN